MNQYVYIHLLRSLISPSDLAVLGTEVLLTLYLFLNSLCFRMLL